MRLITLIFICGILLVIIGFSTNLLTDSANDQLRTVRYGGTFFGLLGIGVSIAGFLLFIINRPQKTGTTLN